MKNITKSGKKEQKKKKTGGIVLYNSANLNVTRKEQNWERSKITVKVQDERETYKNLAPILKRGKNTVDSEED